MRCWNYWINLLYIKESVAKRIFSEVSQPWHTKIRTPYQISGAFVKWHECLVVEESMANYWFAKTLINKPKMEVKEKSDKKRYNLLNREEVWSPIKEMQYQSGGNVDFLRLAIGNFVMIEFIEKPSVFATLVDWEKLCYKMHSQLNVYYLEELCYKMHSELNVYCREELFYKIHF